jgi:acetyltransferase-like isoleucine patch superfamily enzyme
MITSASVVKTLQRTALTRTAYHSARSGGSCVVLRGSKLRKGKGARIDLLAPGAALVVGFNRSVPTPASIHLMDGAVLSVRGAVELSRGVRVLVGQGATLEIGGHSYVNPGSTITCLEHISIGWDCAISWDVNIFDMNGHDLAVAGEPRPKSAPVRIRDHVWVGTGATILPGVTIGEGAVVGAGSVVTGYVPPRALVAGNPARVVHENVEWAL